MPTLKNKALVAVAGSLALDTVMNFPGKFSSHIIPGKIHDLNLSFSLNRLSPGFGGTAGNIAYNLALLQERSSILTAVGTDFSAYQARLKSWQIDIRALVKDKSDRCASAFIITDSADNQIAGFYPGSKQLPLFAKLNKTEISYLIIAPDDKGRMLATQAWAKKRHLPYIFDPGQQVISFSATELKLMIKDAFLVIGNDYEIEIIRRQLKLKAVAAIVSKQALIITKGAQGSEIIQSGKSFLIPALKTEQALDPTGAGDAYRAGLIKGLLSGLTLEKAAKLAAAVAVYAVEHQGTQNHYFTLNSLKKRYYQSFGQSLELA